MSGKLPNSDELPSDVAEVVEVLTKARDIVAAGWCQGAYARDEGGCSVDDRAPTARAHCALGAIFAAGHTGTWGAAEKALASVLPPPPRNLRPISAFNDDPDRTQGEVLAAFDRAIAAVSA